MTATPEPTNAELLAALERIEANLIDTLRITNDANATLHRIVQDGRRRATRARALALGASLGAGLTAAATVIAGQ